MFAFWRYIPIFALFFIGASFLLAEESPLEERISLALSLHDTFQARILLQELQKAYPEDETTLKLHFEYLAEEKDFEAIQELYKKLSPEKKLCLPSSIEEKIAWVVIEKARSSSHPRIRAEAALAAAESQDIRGAHILSELLTDQHQAVRSLAFQLAVPYRDSFIQERAEKLTQSRLPELRVAAAKLLAEQKAKSAEKILLNLVQDTSLSEKDVIEIIGLIAACSEKNTSWIEHAALDTSPSTRALAAATFLEYPSTKGASYINPLLNDNSLTVKQVAATGLGLYQDFVNNKQELLAAFSNLLNDPCFSLQATAAWALLLSASQEHQERACVWFKEKISDAASETNLIAVSRLIRAGKRGLFLAKELLASVSDPLIRLNLSLYLLLHKDPSREALNEIRSACSSRTLFGQKEDGFFSWVGQSNTHDPLISRLPESEDLYFRLYLFALRHHAGDTISQEELAKALHDRSWGISAAAAEFLFQEMLPLDEVLTPLLSHDEESIRVQAALLLAIFSRSKKAALTLLEEYQKASKAGKEVLLLGFGLLPADKTRALLFPLLFDQSQTLRTRAAGVFLSSSYQ